MPRGGKGKKGKEPAEQKDSVEPLRESLRRLSVSEEPSTSSAAQSPPEAGPVQSPPEAGAVQSPPEAEEEYKGIPRSRKPRRRKPRGAAAAQAEQQSPTVQATASLPTIQQSQQQSQDYPALGQPQASFPQLSPQQWRPSHQQGQPPFSSTSSTDYPSHGQPQFPQGSRGPSPRQQAPQQQQQWPRPQPTGVGYPPQQYPMSLPQGYQGQAWGPGLSPQSMHMTPPRQPGMSPQSMHMTPPRQPGMSPQSMHFTPPRQPGMSPQSMHLTPPQAYQGQPRHGSPRQPGMSPQSMHLTPPQAYHGQPTGVSPRQPGMWPQQPGTSTQPMAWSPPHGHEGQSEAALPAEPGTSSQAMVISPPQEQQVQPKGPSPRQKVAPPAYHIPSKLIGKSVQCQHKKVLTNYLPMTIKPIIIYRYDVSYDPDKPKKLLPKAFKKMLKEHFPNETVAYDQMKLAFSPSLLPDIGTDEKKTFEIFVMDDNQKMMNIKVSLKPAGFADTSTILNYMRGGTSLNPPSEAIQCIDVVIRQGTLEKYVKAGRTFFKRPDNPLNLNDGLEMWTGLFQSAIFTSRPYINIDVAHKGFPIHQSMIDVVQMFGFHLRDRLEYQNKRQEKDRLDAFMKGIKLSAQVGAGKRDYIFNGFAEIPRDRKFIFKDEKGKEREISVEDYFEKVKKVRLNYKNINCIWVGPKEKKIVYPLELMEVTYGQVIKKMLNERQLSTMVRAAATSPDIRMEKIYKLIQDMDYSNNVYFKNFGLKIETRFITVDSKVIRPPKLQYGSGEVEPRTGKWFSGRMYDAAKLLKWGYVAFGCGPGNYDKVVLTLKSTAKDMGMEMKEPMMAKFNLRMDDVDRIMSDVSKLGLQLLFVVIGKRLHHSSQQNPYATAKQSAELRCGVLTQCIKENTVEFMNGQTAKNILLKVNAKLMGINQTLQSRNLPRCLQGGGVMVVGADVTHPSPDQTSVPSIAAVSASIDKNCFQYNIALSIQTPKKEMIVEFEDMMVEHMKVYRDRHRELPKKIYVFRDGVSEGQFAQVMHSELRDITKAYQKLNNGQGKPEILFVLVQKRHHTRLFTSGQQVGNVEPGTVVDTDIVHARELDFYLVSHQAIKGTARPTRYHAVCNDGGIPTDEVEQLAYYLCHLYSRCSRSVSYPTPTYYAHLACARARSLTLGTSYKNEDLDKPIRLRVVENILKTSRMFYV